jgi:multidrug efflux pump subunit AcrA (membrane-fusion protein)
VWERHRWVVRWLVTVVLLGVIYYTTTAVVAWLTAPRIEMTMSPITGPVAVAAEPAKVQEIMEKVTYTGSISPYEEVTVYPRWEGWVQEFTLYEGDRVEEGQVIARLDRAEIGAALEKARAAAASAELEKPVIEAEVEALRANLVAHRAALAEAQANALFWERDIRRVEILFQRGALAEVAYDEGKKQYDSAVARVAEHEARIKLVEAKLAEAQARLAAVPQRIKAARAEAEQVETRFGYTDVRAPISGRVAKRHIYAGILVKPGMPIVQLQDLSRVRVQAKVAEKDMAKVRVGTEAVVQNSALPNPHTAVRAKVTSVFPQLDPLTRTATVEMVIPNPGEQIKTDMYAIIDFVLGRKPKAVTIPRLAVERDQRGQPMVFVTDGVSAMSRPVKLGIAAGDRVEVLEGVKEGEMVIYKGQRGLVEGQQVNIVAGL